MFETVWMETCRLILRTVTEDDVKAVALHWRLGQGELSHQEAEAQVQWMIANHRRNAPGRIVHLCLAVIEKETRELIGWCGLDHRDREQDGPVLFYVLREDRWGRGLGTEAARGVLECGFREFELERIDGAAAADNPASLRVMEKIGLRRTGCEPDGIHFSLTRAEFSQRPGDSRDLPPA